MTSRAVGFLVKKDAAYDSRGIASTGEKPSGVHESANDFGWHDKIEALLGDIVTRLDRIEAKIDENFYPPESSIRPECIKSVKKARADIKKGKGKLYHSVDDFFREIVT